MNADALAIVSAARTNWESFANRMPFPESAGTNSILSLPGSAAYLAPHRVRRRVASRRGVLLDERERAVPLPGVPVVHGLDDLESTRWGREQRGREYEVLQHGSSCERRQPSAFSRGGSDSS